MVGENGGNEFERKEKDGEKDVGKEVDTCAQTEEIFDDGVAHLKFCWWCGEREVGWEVDGKLGRTKAG